MIEIEVSDSSFVDLSVEVLLPLGTTPQALKHVIIAQEFDSCRFALDWKRSTCILMSGLLLRLLLHCLSKSTARIHPSALEMWLHVIIGIRVLFIVRMYH